MVGRTPEGRQDPQKEEMIDPATGRPTHESLVPTMIRGESDEDSYDPDDLLPTTTPGNRGRPKRIVLGRPDPNDPNWSKNFIDRLLK